MVSGSDILKSKGPVPDEYNPEHVESLWYDWWQESGFFKPEFNKDESAEKFVMVIPPPNVTGTLHLGHALTNSIEDSIVRWNRMKGRRTLWVPGCDHAGIATQVVVERKLWREEKKSRHDLGREKFIEKVWQWKNEKGGVIYLQLKKMGSSLDWSRESFTMDPKLTKAVNECFIRLHENGKIYRSNRLVNWSCTLKSAISEIEVDKKEIGGRTLLSIPGYERKVEFGVLVLFKYRLADETSGDADDSNSITVATTRIETMLGDVAIAVHPDDQRYARFHGKCLKHPFIADRRLPVVCDKHVDMNFGTGAVKITPAHDQNDYDIGTRLNLPFITVFDDNGNMADNCAQFSGMKRFDCRYAVIDELKKLNLYVETKSNPMVIPFCSRSKDVIEPLIKPQWYVDCSEMAKNALEFVDSGELEFVPEQNKLWVHWMANIRDWCISRQLWWGHRIPAYRVEFRDRSSRDPLSSDCWVSAHSLQEAVEKACAKFKATAAEFELKQDEDVLDTWFSSALFPFSVMGWPDATEDLARFYPLSLMETGHDILFFWVARMVFFGHTLLGRIPFPKVLLHPIVRDAHGRKMSKSLGNVIDPLDVIAGITLDRLHAKLREGNLDERELKKAQDGQRKDFPKGIPECGTDALRFALCAMCQGRDLNLDISRVHGYRCFCNKIWNATKFALIYLKDDFQIPIELVDDQTKLLGNESLIDRWILSRLSLAADAANRNFEQFNFPEVTAAIYNFWQHELCAVYLECLKPVFQAAETHGDSRKLAAQVTLYRCLNGGLRLLAPFMPFICEELFHLLPKTQLNNEPSISVAAYPQSTTCPWRDCYLEQQFDFAYKIVREIRSARDNYNLLKKQKTEAYVICGDAKMFEYVSSFAPVIETLSYCSRIETLSEIRSRDGCAILTVSDKCTVYLVLKDQIDFEKEIGKLAKKQTEREKSRMKLVNSMAAKDYDAKVPEAVRNANSDKLRQIDDEIAKIIEAIGTLRSI